jgi:glycosyltransferase involved in cell wall biosynthesis
MRTILFVEDSPAASYGGSKRVLVNLITRLDRSAWRPCAAIRTDGPYRADLEAAGVPTQVYGSLAPRGAPLPRPAGIRRLGLATSSTGTVRRGALRRFLRDGRAAFRYAIRDRLAARRLCAALPGDISLVHYNARMASGYEWAHVARRLGAPLVIHDHEVWREPPRAYRRVARRAACLICLTEERAALVREFCGGAVRTAVVPNGIDLDAMAARRQPERAASLKAALRGRPLLVTAAHYQPWKGQLQALDAAARLVAGGRSFVWQFCGHPTDRAYFDAVQAKVRALGLQDCVLVDQQRDDVPALLEVADLAVQTAVEPEPFSLFVLEAMAFGVPVVAAREGGHTEVVRHGVEGLLYTPRDAAALEETLAAALADSALRRRCGSAARERVRDAYSITAQVERLESIYREAVAGVPPRT